MSSLIQHYLLQDESSIADVSMMAFGDIRSVELIAMTDTSSKHLIANYVWSDFDTVHGLQTDYYKPYDKEPHMGTMEEHASKYGRLDRKGFLYAIPDFPESQLDLYFREEVVTDRSFIPINSQLEKAYNLFPFEEFHREDFEAVAAMHRGLNKETDAFLIDKTVAREIPWIKNDLKDGFDPVHNELSPTSHQTPIVWTVTDTTSTAGTERENCYETKEETVSCLIFPFQAKFQRSEVFGLDLARYWFHDLIDWDFFKHNPESWMSYQRLRPFPKIFLKDDYPEFEGQTMDYWHQYNLMSQLPVRIVDNPCIVKYTDSDSRLIDISFPESEELLVNDFTLTDPYFQCSVDSYEVLAKKDQVLIYTGTTIHRDPKGYFDHKTRDMLFILNTETAKGGMERRSGTLVLSGFDIDQTEVSFHSSGLSQKNSNKIEIAFNYGAGEILAFSLKNIGAFDNISIGLKDGVNTKGLYYKFGNVEGLNTLSASREIIVQKVK